MIGLDHVWARTIGLKFGIQIDQSDKSQSAHIPQCTIQDRAVHISVLNGALWDLRDRSIEMACRINVYTFERILKFVMTGISLQGSNVRN